ncbi:MAG TPA: class I SAM-dependent methyltransferase [Vicinamibacterales bacterium]|nr:class I SAM-dependent methyltransferase [Vicinamibacterales bacterium]
MSLRDDFGEIDIYLFDQILRGRIGPGDRVLDAGCGSGRNLVYLLRAGIDVSATDRNAMAVAEVRALAAALAPGLAADRFREEPVERSSFPDGAFTVVISSAVLHFAADDRQFREMVDSMWRLLAPGGMLFARLATSIGIESRIQALGNRRFALPDGSTRYLADETLLMDLTRRLGGQLLDPLKTTLVQDQRAMTTWVVRKP